MKNKNGNFRILITVLCVFLLTFHSKAQIEDFRVGTTTRKILVYAPSGIEPNRPLLLSLHGMNQDIAYQQNQTKWETVAKANNFVVVYPGGISNSWDISGTRDTDFILAIIDEMYKRYGIDRDRVYLSGFSMGGMMTYHAATKIADKIAAFAPVSGYLMGGPNTKSSRPIPIIHTHGTADDVVVYSGVQRCMDAWITRNNCPKTAQVTKPYPANKPNSSGTKYYWGAGTDSVEIVLLSIKGAGHWHSIDPNGINTSQEIWNFCKNFSLGYGVSKFEYASVVNQDPKQIQVEFSLPIKESESYGGFSVKVDGELVDIESITLADSVHLAINLTDSILNSNEISISYVSGNVVSTYEKKLTEFSDKLVENLLAGAPPRIVELAVTENGNVLVAKFNKHMLLPSDISSLVLNAQFNGDLNIPITDCSFSNSDSTTYAFTLAEQVFADYNLLLTYSGNNLVAADSSFVKNFTDYQVTNKSTGLPVQIVSGALASDAFTIALEFSKSMAMSDAQLGQFSFFVNGKKVTVKEFSVMENSIRFALSGNLYYADSIKATYTPGTITASDKGQLEAFSNFIVENPLQEPTWYPIPAKVEAEDYALQYGTDTEQTVDTGGGLNVGWIEDNDWLVYAIENNSDQAEFEITFRVAAQAAGGQFNYAIDNVKVGQVTVPNTGGWQIWQSVVKKISINKGTHYFKMYAVTGGFNINYLNIQQVFTGINTLEMDEIIIYPNPVSNKIVIKSSGFLFNKVEISDMVGNTVVIKAVDYNTEFGMPLSLPDGSYILKISNDKEIETRKIIIQNN
ncbi:MAG: carbohydrate-binding protein [Prolixibacteraceae bacterium]|nr:carbohydrate-binding protein [Prolixibacteraceae bacterium]